MVWRFLRTHVLQAALLVMGGLLTVYGLVSDAFSLWTAGVPPMAWAGVGAAIFFAVTVVILAAFSLEVEALKSSPAPKGGASTNTRVAHELANYRRHFAAFLKAVDRRDVRSSRPMEDLRGSSQGFESVLTTLEKMGFQVPRLDLQVDPLGYVEIAVEYADRVAPYLLRDHVDEAKAASAEMAKKAEGYQANRAKL